MTADSQYGMQQDDEAQDYSEATVVNVTDEPVTFTIATVPGSKPRRYRLAPHGENGDRIHLQTGYTQPYQGAGRKMIRPIIETRTMREVYPAGHGYPAGKQLPMVVHEDKAELARRAWVTELARRDKAAKAAKTVAVSVQLDPTTGEAKAATVQPDAGDAGSDPVVASGPPATSPAKPTARGRA